MQRGFRGQHVDCSLLLQQIPPLDTMGFFKDLRCSVADLLSTASPLTPAA